MRRDGNVNQNENISVTLDTFHDRRTAFYFQTSPIGAMRDALVADQRNANFDWNGVWLERSRSDEHGWTFEIAVPFKTLRYPVDGEQVWGINVRRTVRWKNETSYLAPVGAAFGGRGTFVISASATLVGLDAPLQSINLEVKPYAKAGTATDVRAVPALLNDFAGDVGVDAKYGLTRGLIADVTLNTDFAQVEADDQQVNLTRASLFFPEKREFFLEGQNVFMFAGATGTIGGGGMNTGGLMDNGTASPLTPVMFFSRRIGLDDGAEVPIRVGARLTGRAGRYSIGMLNLQTGQAARASSTEPTNFSVVRIKRDILRRSAIGVIGTNRSPRTAGAGTNQLYGADLMMQFFQNVTITSYVAQSRTPGVKSAQTSYLGRFDYGADRYGFNVERLSVDRNFTPEIAFVPRPAFRRSFASARFSPRLQDDVVRKMSWQTSLDYITEPGGALQSRKAQGSFRVDLNNGDQWQADYSRYYERLTNSLIIAGARMAPGAYNFGEFSTVYVLGPPRRLAGRLEFNRGSFYDGKRTIAGINGRIGVGARLGVEPRVSINWIDVSSGSVVAKVVSTRTTYTMSPRMFVSGLVQFNSSNASLTSNIRFRWEYVPGSDLFVVYSDGRDTSPIGFTSLDSRTFVVKLTRMVRW